MSVTPEPVDSPEQVAPPQRSPLWWASWSFVVVVVRRAADLNLGLVAAGIAFYAMLGLFPAIAALVSLYGLIADPSEVQRQLAALADLMPREAYGLLDATVAGLLQKTTAQLNIGFLLGLALSLFTARVAVGALMSGLDVAYQIPKGRKFLHGQAVGLVLTCLLIGLAVVAVVAVTVVPIALAVLPLPPVLRTGLGVTRWVILSLVVVATMAILYRRGPSRGPDLWTNVGPGALSASVLWVAGSVAFSAYVSRFGAYDAMYGSLGAVIVMLLWLWMTALVILVGAVINVEALRLRTDRRERRRVRGLLKALN